MEVRAETADRANWLFVATDENGDPRNFVTEKGWDPSVFALMDDVKSFHKGANPTTYFFDSGGKLIEKHVGPLEKAELEGKLKNLQ